MNDSELHRGFWQQAGLGGRLAHDGGNGNEIAATIVWRTWAHPARMLGEGLQRSDTPDRVLWQCGASAKVYSRAPGNRVG